MKKVVQKAERAKAIDQARRRRGWATKRRIAARGCGIGRRAGAGADRAAFGEAERPEDGEEQDDGGEAEGGGRPEAPGLHQAHADVGREAPGEGGDGEAQRLGAGELALADVVHDVEREGDVEERGPGGAAEHAEDERGRHVEGEEERRRGRGARRRGCRPSGG